MRRFIWLAFLRCLCLAAMLAVAGCVNHNPEARVRAALDAAELVSAEHILDDDSTVALVIRAQDGQLWSVRNTQARPLQFVLGSPQGQSWKTTSFEVQRLLQRVMDREFARVIRKQRPLGHDETWRLRTVGEFSKRLMSDPHGLARR